MTLLTRSKRNKRQRDVLVVHLSLLIQVLSILQLSTVCASRATTAAVAGAVLSPTAPGAAVARRDGSTAVASSRAAPVASPGQSFGAAARRTQQAQAACSAFVSSGFKKDKHARSGGRAAARLHVVSGIHSVFPATHTLPPDRLCVVWICFCLVLSGPFADERLAGNVALLSNLCVEDASPCGRE